MRELRFLVIRGLARLRLKQPVLFELRRQSDSSRSTLYYLSHLQTKTGRSSTTRSLNPMLLLGGSTREGSISRTAAFRQAAYLGACRTSPCTCCESIRPKNPVIPTKSRDSRWGSECDTGPREHGAEGEKRGLWARAR